MSERTAEEQIAEWQVLVERLEAKNALLIRALEMTRDFLEMGCVDDPDGELSDMVNGLLHGGKP